MRTVRRIVKSVEAHEGAGFVVHRPFPVQELSHIDPFLLIDELGPTVYAPGKAVGAPDHPHRGFETITYILQGEVLHEDSSGAKSELKPGDVQWMTAGRGVIHSELPTERLLKNGGAMHGVQIWINLPKCKKMIAPRYQDLRAAEIPVIKDSPAVKVKLLSGTLSGISGPAKNQNPILFAHLSISPGGKWSTSEIPSANTTLAYILTEGGEAGGVSVQRTDLVEFSREEGEIAFTNPSKAEDFSFLLLSAAPINEPIARMGPFVMNTHEELGTAYHDYLEGRMGALGKAK